jgi:hypothetical protein
MRRPAPWHDPGRARARTQASIHDRLQSAGFFTAEEQELLRWASNSNSIKPPQRSNALEYKKATAMEALVGRGAGLAAAAAAAAALLHAGRQPLQP